MPATVLRLISPLLLFGAVTTCATGEPPGTFEIVYGENARVQQVNMGGGLLHLLVSNRGMNPWTACSVGHDALHHWSEHLEMLNTRAILTDAIQRDAVFAIEYTVPEGFDVPYIRKLFFMRQLATDSSNRARVFPSRIELERDEFVLGVLESKRDTLVTSRRMVQLGKTDLVETRFPSRIPVYGRAMCDISGNELLCGWNESGIGGAPRLHRIALDAEGRGRVMDQTSLLESSPSRRLTGVCASPQGDGLFFVSTGSLAKGGALLTIGSTGEVEKIFDQSRRGRPSCISGIEDVEVHIRGDEAYSSPVLGIGPTADGIAFVTDRSVYQLSRGEIESLGSAQYELIGNFYVARNVKSVFLVLERSATLEGMQRESRRCQSRVYVIRR